jgi:hypothetical protein
MSDHPPLIQWLPRAIPLLTNGHGPTVVGTCDDMPSASAEYWMRRSESYDPERQAA